VTKIANINIKKLNDNAIVPTRGSNYAAGYDLYANITKPITILPHYTAKIGTGIAMEIPEGYFGGIFARSGLATKYGLRPSNCVGIIDSDYRGEIIVALHNDSNLSQEIRPNERIAQLVLIPFIAINFNTVNELSDTERSDGGFGSTGLK